MNDVLVRIHVVEFLDTDVRRGVFLAGQEEIAVMTERMA